MAYQSLRNSDAQIENFNRANTVNLPRQTHLSAVLRLAQIGSIMGSGGLIVMDETSCMVDVARFFMEFCMDESCGKCIPCRAGTVQMHDILRRITTGEANEDDLEMLKTLSDLLRETSLCGLGQTAPNPVISTLKYFPQEYEAHIHEKRCPAGHCHMTAAGQEVAS